MVLWVQVGEKSGDTFCIFKATDCDWGWLGGLCYVPPRNVTAVVHCRCGGARGCCASLSLPPCSAFPMHGWSR